MSFMQSVRTELECGGRQTVTQARNGEIDKSAQLERQAVLLVVDQMHRTGWRLEPFEQELQQVLP